MRWPRFVASVAKLCEGDVQRDIRMTISLWLGASSTLPKNSSASMHRPTAPAAAGRGRRSPRPSQRPLVTPKGAASAPDMPAGVAALSAARHEPIAELTTSVAELLLARVNRTPIELTCRMPGGGACNAYLRVTSFNLLTAAAAQKMEARLSQRWIKTRASWEEETYPTDQRYLARLTDLVNEADVVDHIGDTLLFLRSREQELVERARPHEPASVKMRASSVRPSTAHPRGNPAGRSAARRPMSARADTRGVRSSSGNGHHRPATAAHHSSGFTASAAKQGSDERTFESWLRPVAHSMESIEEVERALIASRFARAPVPVPLPLTLPAC